MTEDGVMEEDVEESFTTGDDRSHLTLQQLSLQLDQVGSQNQIGLRDVREPQLCFSHLIGEASVSLKKLTNIPLQKDSDLGFSDIVVIYLGFSGIMVIYQA